MAFFKKNRCKKNVFPMAGLLTIVLLLACYIWENVPLSYGESFDVLYFVERYIQRHFGHNETIDDGLFINMSYDKAVADVDLYDMKGLFTGRVDITDRETMDRLLSRLEEDDTYRYIFLDVRFEEGVTTPYDSSLFARIARMRDIVIATHRDTKLASPLLEPKAYLSDFKTTVTSTGFTRYQFLQSGRESVALKMYEDLSGEDISQIWRLPFFKSGKQLCHNSIFVRIPEDFSENLVDVRDGNEDDGTDCIYKQRYFDCGPQIDEDFPLDERAKGKIVVIGDFVNDVAGTYMGEQPNPYLAFLATESLLSGRHKVGYGYVVLLAILFFLIFCAILADYAGAIIVYVVDFLVKLIRILWSKITGREVKTGHSSLSKFVWNFFGFGIFTSLICVVVFLIFKSTFSVFIPSLMFSIVASIPREEKKNDEKVQLA